MSNVIFHKELLKHYQVVDKAGTYIVAVAQDITERNLYVEDSFPRYLIPLRVIRSEDLVTLSELLSKKRVTFKSINHLFLTGAVFDNGDIDKLLLPTKGEQVVATFEYKNDVLLCTHIKLIDRDELAYINLSAVSDLYNLAKEFYLKK